MMDSLYTKATAALVASHMVKIVCGVMTLFAIAVPAMKTMTTTNNSKNN